MNELLNASPASYFAAGLLLGLLMGIAGTAAVLTLLANHAANLRRDG